ncbi:hypothetical protein NDA03_26535 [Trichocoleus sp. Lan]|uniref:hypothetical protein n=1 Tax=Trichocoleus sp. Lan TaxID=2933927 RepID=UPI0032972769
MAHGRRLSKLRSLPSAVPSSESSRLSADLMAQSLCEFQQIYLRLTCRDIKLADSV